MQAGALHRSGGEEQGCLQGALGGGGEEVQAGALHRGGGEEQGCLQRVLGGGGEEVQAKANLGSCWGSRVLQELVGGTCKSGHSIGVVGRSRGSRRRRKKALPCVLAEEIYRTSIMLDLILFQKVSDGLKAPILPTVNETTLRTTTKSKSIKLY